MIFLFQRTQEQVQNSRGKWAISVRATEGLLYRVPDLPVFFIFQVFTRKQNELCLFLHKVI